MRTGSAHKAAHILVGARIAVGPTGAILIKSGVAGSVVLAIKALRVLGHVLVLGTGLATRRTVVALAGPINLTILILHDLVFAIRARIHA